MLIAAQTHDTRAALDADSAHWALHGPLTFHTVAALETQALSAPHAADQVDLSQVTAVDSSAVALLLAIKRANPSVRFENSPEALLSLASLYDVKDVIF